jgi:hypothetical protein
LLPRVGCLALDSNEVVGYIADSHYDRSQ